MGEDGKTVVPVWTLATKDVHLPDLGTDTHMTPARLADLRSILATLCEAPITTLEVHPVPVGLDRSSGIALHAASPLAQNLSQLIGQTSRSTPAVPQVSVAGEALYRMVVPAKVVDQIGKGLVRPMTSKAAAGGVHSALVNSSGIAAQATFVPVAGQAAAAGAATGAAGTAGVAAASAGALTVAAPLVFMAVAVGVSAYADRRREQAIERITEMLEKLDQTHIDRERSELDGCRDAVDKATAILLDQGRIGVALGLDSAVYAINTAIEAARRRLTRWQKSLSELGTGPVELAAVRKAFPGVDQEGGEFHAQLELAALAIALKQRVIVLQAVEQAQLEGADHPFENFVRILRADRERLVELESGIASVRRGLSALELTRSRGIRDVVFTRGEVDDLLRASHRLHQLGSGVDVAERASDVAIDVVRNRDGSVVVLPAATT
ncbi:hypothetical protein ACRDU6_07860 [Mycolicibacterium sp. ELW1]|uniref:hypothetical protein n=1 Tax=Mycobacteriaceae TaxID=1762 RepID=UPI0011F09365|nr:hypothetical protein [Mycobacterium sp. ELW1]QEN12606.1 hypothetical protein D3H54_04415 [Mycobacterium sp. ELW1]